MNNLHLSLMGEQMDQQLADSKVLADMSDLMKKVFDNNKGAAQMDPEQIALIAKSAGCNSR